MDYKLINKKVQEYKHFILCEVYKVFIKDGIEQEVFLYRTTEHKNKHQIGVYSY